MVVILAMTGGALWALHSFNTLAASDPELLERVLFSIRQQAGVMAALSAAVFAVITALQKGTAAVASAGAALPSVPSVFGVKAGLTAGG